MDTRGGVGELTFGRVVVQLMSVPSQEVRA